MNNYLWLIPILPLAGFLINGLGRNVLPKSIIGAVGSLVILAAFGLSLGAFLQVSDTGQAINVSYFTWIQVGKFTVPFAFLIDQLSAIMLLIITGVGFLIHVYSTGYMHDDKGFGKYFAYLNLFVFFMLLLVLGSKLYCNVYRLGGCLVYAPTCSLAFGLPTAVMPMLPKKLL